ncbi:MAG: hypothetical protein Q7J60_05705 [Bradyrhizobium sp.]|uniref:hypothetical protein n=1 Tax=Bradyrhizobium sp. TaxID=376 RepID=UPI00271F4217|nr:hypothetical protein [Bradyrhizobium sp.]MDO9561092.1 hypothetical protein [Bradyrhizobium sp.]MDP3692734.1 hypothetical protein [Bradyrhizobium sp.]
MSESHKIDQNPTEGHPTERNPVSAVKLPTALTASIDAWARAHAVNRSEAIRQLIELGLTSEATAGVKPVPRLNAIAVEEQVASQLDQFIDPDTPQEERERRIHRLTEGPPEFVDLRIDLPKRRS